MIATMRRFPGRQNALRRADQTIGRNQLGPLRNINHGAWLLVTARLTAVYIGTAAAEAFCAAAHRAQRAKESTGDFRLDLGCLSELRRCGRVGPVKAV
jgi:hypothetical protein